MDFWREPLAVSSTWGKMGEELSMTPKFLASTGYRLWCHQLVSGVRPQDQQFVGNIYSSV